MLTDENIGALIISPKKISKKSPAIGYDSREGTQKYCSLILESVDPEGPSFSVFIRQNSQFIENFSIGLRCQTGDRELGTVTLVRYNGPHVEASRHHDGHYAKSHIHRITAGEIQSGSIQPQEKHRRITDKYSTFEDAVVVFFTDTSIANWQNYFPELTQKNLFNGHQ